jgi:hypothetical protein
MLELRSLRARDSSSHRTCHRVNPACQQNACLCKWNRQCERSLKQLDRRQRVVEVVFAAAYHGHNDTLAPLVSDDRQTVAIASANCAMVTRVRENIPR